MNKYVYEPNAIEENKKFRRKGAPTGQQRWYIEHELFVAPSAVS